MKTSTFLKLEFLAALLGALIYVVLAFWNRRIVDLKLALLCLMNGVGIPAGLFMMLCAFYPAWLVRIIDERGKTVEHLEGYTIEIEGEKLLCIMVGGFAILFLSMVTLAEIFKSQRRKEPKSSRGSS